jgi:hypothetical protein
MNSQNNGQKAAAPRGLGRGTVMLFIILGTIVGIVADRYAFKPPVRPVKPLPETRPAEAAPPPSPAPIPTAQPEEDPVQAWLESRKAKPAMAYLFGRFSRHKAPAYTAFSSGSGQPDLRLETSGNVFFSSQGAVFIDGGRLLSQEAGKALSKWIKAKDVFSLEAYLLPADTRHSGPARIITISYDGSKRNFTLGQDGLKWAVRLRTTATGINGTSPEFRIEGLSLAWTHLVVTFNGEDVKVYINGREAYTTAAAAGRLKDWDESFALAFGNEAFDRRDWEGVLNFALFYTRVLTPQEVLACAEQLPPGSPALNVQPAPAPADTEPPDFPEDIF